MSHTNAILVQAGTLRHCGWKQADTPQALHIWKIVARRGHAKMNIATADKTAGGSKSAMNYALGLTWNPCVDSFRTSSPTFSKIMLLTFFLLSFALFSLLEYDVAPDATKFLSRQFVREIKKKGKTKNKKKILFWYLSLFLSLSLRVTKDERITLVAKLQSNEDTLMRDWKQGLVTTNHVGGIKLMH